MTDNYSNRGQLVKPLWKCFLLPKWKKKVDFQENMRFKGNFNYSAKKNMILWIWLILQESFQEQ